MIKNLTNFSFVFSKNNVHNLSSGILIYAANWCFCFKFLKRVHQLSEKNFYSLVLLFENKIWHSFDKTKIQNVLEWKSLNFFSIFLHFFSPFFEKKFDQKRSFSGLQIIIILIEIGLELWKKAQNDVFCIS